MARFSAMFLPERSGFGLNELLDARGSVTTARAYAKTLQEDKPYDAGQSHT